MVTNPLKLTTGLPGLDRILKGLLPGDNVVWQVADIEDYGPFVHPFVAAALEQGKTVVYYRFAKHEPLLTEEQGVQVHALDPQEGFETFITQVRQGIRAAGRGATFVFDCLSGLAADWYSDEMLGNFFMLTCPYLFDMETVAYFAILRGNHTANATSAISDTTQLLLDVFRHNGKLYVHPLKVQQRHSPTLYTLHAWEGDDFVPVTRSADISEVLAGMPWLQLDSMTFRLGVWNRTFLRALEIADPANEDRCSLEEAERLTSRLLRMVVSRDERMLPLAARYLGLSHLLEIGKRMIGTGLVGGKSVGMLLARAILRSASPRWAQLLEPHDSFYIGSDVFYTFLVRNGIWWVREKQRDLNTLFEGAETARQRMLTGQFPDYIENQFAQMLDYFGQSPIIVRSSSLLEDNFGNAFAGKYESIFCANQGPRDQRLEDFLSAVRTVYASAMSDRALQYRAQRGLLDRDEQMALLVQRVSGAVHGSLFFPHIAGVGLSFNPYVWNPHIDPHAGVIRLVFGLGTRAVDRSDDDYTRVVALNAPQRLPEASLDGLRRYAQRRVDVLDLGANRLVSYDFPEVVEKVQDLPLDLFASRDAKMEQRAADKGLTIRNPWVLTFERLLDDTDFVPTMRDMLKTLEDAYQYPVDIEFTANFRDDGSYKINLLQCRPLQVKGGGAIVEPPSNIPSDCLVLETNGPIIGQSCVTTVDRIIYLVPALYGQLPTNQRHQVARLVGQLTHTAESQPPQVLMLLGPGRWGTTTPTLGVPVTFAEISTVSVLCEIVAMRDDLVPDVSLGTHFLNELIEMDMLYLALFPSRQGNFLNTNFLTRMPNRLTDLLPQASQWSDLIRVVDARDLPPGTDLRLYANSLTQRVVCYLSRQQS